MCGSVTVKYIVDDFDVNSREWTCTREKGEKPKRRGHADTEERACRSAENQVIVMDTSTQGG